MPPAQRIALIAPAKFADLAKTLAQAAAGSHVRRYEDLYADGAQLFADRPDAVVVARSWQLEDVGALRLLVRHLAPNPIVVVTRDSDQLAPATIMGLGASTVPSTVGPTRLAELLRPAPSSEDASHAVPELARGLADEINNPLMFALGHLQLLEAALTTPAATDADERTDAGQSTGSEQQNSPRQQNRAAPALPALAATRSALERIEAAMTDLEWIGAAASRTPGNGVQVDIAQELHQTLNRAGISHCIPAQGAVVRGDPAMLQALIDHLVRVASALAAATAEPSHFDLIEDADNQHWRIWFSVAGTALPQWHVREAFAPYYVTRILRGSPHGLSLVLVDAVARGHGGRGLSDRETVDGADRIRIGADLSQAL